MNVPSVVARSLLEYIKAGGPEISKASTMLLALGWNPDSTPGDSQAILQARALWVSGATAIISEQSEIPF